MTKCYVNLLAEVSTAEKTSLRALQLPDDSKGKRTFLMKVITVAKDWIKSSEKILSEAKFANEKSV